MKFWLQVLLALFYVKQPQINQKKKKMFKFGEFSCKKSWNLTRAFLCRINRKQQQNDKKWCGIGLDVKPGHTRLVSNFGSFLCQKSWKFDRKEYDYVSGAKPSHLGLDFNFVSFRDFRAWKNHEILTWNFLDPLLCQTTTNQPKVWC